MSLADELQNQCDCWESPGECLFCRSAERMRELEYIADAAEQFMCRWPKIKQHLDSLPGSKTLGDDLYKAVFGRRK